MLSLSNLTGYLLTFYQCHLGTVVGIKSKDNYFIVYPFSSNEEFKSTFIKLGSGKVKLWLEDPWFGTRAGTNEERMQRSQNRATESQTHGTSKSFSWELPLLWAPYIGFVTKY